MKIKVNDNSPELLEWGQVKIGEVVKFKHIGSHVVTGDAGSSMWLKCMTGQAVGLKDGILVSGADMALHNYRYIRPRSAELVVEL